MDFAEVWRAMQEAVREETSDPRVELRPGMTADDIPGWDSLAHVRIVMNLEARIGADIEISDTYKAATVDDLCRIVLRSPTARD
jgi:acyl carrier protein